MRTFSENAMQCILENLSGSKTTITFFVCAENFWARKTKWQN